MNAIAEKIDLSSLSVADLKAVLAEKEKEAADQKEKEKQEYQHRRNTLVNTLFISAQHEHNMLKNFKKTAYESLEAFYEEIKKYGNQEKEGKGNFSIVSDDGKYKVVYRKQKVSRFDERATMAEAKLKEFLESFVKVKDKKIYKLVVSLLERNKVSGDYDIKLISRLYAMENDFDSPLWKESIQLFKESYNEADTSTYVQFFEKNARGDWDNLSLNFAALKF